jgi:hypothetical protein
MVLCWSAGRKEDLFTHRFGAQSRADIPWIVFVIFAILAFHRRILLGLAVFPFDYDGYHYPLLHYIGHEIAKWHFPLYDPYVYSGMPLYLNTQAALFYPVHLLYFTGLALFKVETTHYLINLFGVMHFALGGIFFYYLARHYAIRPVFSAAGAIIYSLNGYILAQSQHLGLIETFSWMPLLFLLLSKFLRKPGIRIASGMGVIIALAILIGFLPLALTGLIVFGIFLLVGLFAGPHDTRAKLIGLSIAAAIVVCITAVVTVPIVTADQPMEALGMHPVAPALFLKTLLWPNVFKTFDWQAYNGPFDPTASYLYAGLIIPFLVVPGLLLFWKKAAAVTVSFMFSVLLAFFPVVQSLKLSEVTQYSALIRPENFLFFMVLFGILLSLLVMERLSGKGWVLGVIIAAQSGVMVIPMLRTAWTKNDIRIVKVMVIASLVMLAVLCIRSQATGLIGILMAAHLFAVNLNCHLWAMPNRPGAVTERTMDFGNEDLLLALKKSAEPYRVAVDNQYLGGAWNGSWRIWRIESIGGFEPVRSQKYLDMAVRELSDWHTERLFNVARFDSPLLKLLNVKYWIGRSDHPPGPSASRWRLVFPGYHSVYEGLDFHSRYAVVPMESVSINQAAKAATYSPSAVRAGAVDSIQTSPGNANFLIHVNDAHAFLFISERNYRGWEVMVDGLHVEPLTVNEILMGFPVSQGRHSIALQFKMPYRGWIIAITLLGICLVIGCFFFSRTKIKK